MILQILSLLAVGLTCRALQPAEITLLSPQGLEFKVKDVSGLQRVGFHYSINSPLHGAEAAQLNYDEASKSPDGYWHHRDINVVVHTGDTVYYWLFYEINGRGSVKTDYSWTATDGSQSGSGSQSHSGHTLTTTMSPSHGGHTSHTDTGGHGHVDGHGSTHNGLRLIFEDNFDNGFDTSKWSNEISAFGGGNWEFQIYSPEPANTFVKNGALYLKPTLTADKFGENFLFHGVLDVAREWGSCTKSEFYGCLRNSKDAMIPPAMSSKVISKTSFRYGRVEVEAQMPIGDWLWTSIWLMPKDEVYGGWPRSGEIDITENRCNRNYGQFGINRMMSTLHWGPAWNNDIWATTTQSKLMNSGNWGDDYHLYTMDWDENGIVISVDNVPVLTEHTPANGWWNKGGFSGNNIWSHSKAAPFDQEFFLQMNVAVGGTNGFFPDGVQNGGYSKPWSNNDPKAPEKFWAARHLWHPTWEGDKAAMKVRAVRIYKKV